MTPEVGSPESGALSLRAVRVGGAVQGAAIAIGLAIMPLPLAPRARTLTAGGADPTAALVVGAAWVEECGAVLGLGTVVFLEGPNSMLVAITAHTDSVVGCIHADSGAARRPLAFLTVFLEAVLVMLLPLTAAQQTHMPPLAARATALAGFWAGGTAATTGFRDERREAGHRGDGRGEATSPRGVLSEAPGELVEVITVHHASPIPQSGNVLDRILRTN